MTVANFYKNHKFLAVAAGFFSILIFTFIAGGFYLNYYGLKNILNSQGSAKLGRTFSVDGDAHINWHGLTPSIHLEKIRLANSTGSADPDMLQIETLDFRIALRKLLVGQLNFPEIVMNKPKLILEKNDADHNNWDFPALSKGKAVTAAVVPDDRDSFPIIGQMTITNGVVQYKDDVKKLKLDLALDTASGSGGKGHVGLKLSGNGTLQDKVFKIDASGGSLDELRSDSEDFPLDLHLAMGSTIVTFKGTFRDPVQLSGIDATLDLQGDNLADLFNLTGIPLPPTPPYKIGGQLMKKGKVWSYDHFAGHVGTSDLAGNLSYDVSSERGMVRADLQSELLDADDLGGFIGLAPSTKKGKAVSAEQKELAAQQAASARLLPDVPINLDRLRAADMDVTLKAKKINAPSVPVTSLDVHLMLTDGVLTLDPLDLGLASGHVDGKLILDGSKDIPVVTSDLAIKKLSLRSFFKDTRFENFTGGLFGGKVEIKGHGKSLADVLATSAGKITFVMSGGKFSLLLIEAAGLDISEATPLLLSHDEVTQIRCGVGDFKVTQGILNSQIFVFDTSDSNVNGRASINLKDETIDAEIEAHSKDKSLLTARTPITITGRLKKPSIGLSPGELGARGAAAAVLGTLLTPLAAVIPFIELGVGKDSDCKGLIAETHK